VNLLPVHIYNGNKILSTYLLLENIGGTDG
jgi:hypothetical protein